MSIQLGIYDFFGYAVPGGLYMLLLAYLLVSFDVTEFDFSSLNNLSLIQTLIIIALAYLAGLIIDRVAVLWYRIFEPKHLADVVLGNLKKNHPNLDFRFQGKDWPILIAYLQREKPETASEIHRFNAIHIMLKNASFGFLILSIAEGILFAVNTSVWAHLPISVGAVAASVISARQAVRFKRWFFSASFEAVIAKGLEQSELVIKHNPDFGLSEDRVVSDNRQSSQP